MIYIKFAADQRDGLLVRVCDAVASSQESLKRCRRSLRRINYFMLVAAWEKYELTGLQPDRFQPRLSYEGAALGYKMENHSIPGLHRKSPRT